MNVIMRKDWSTETSTLCSVSRDVPNDMTRVFQTLFCTVKSSHLRAYRMCRVGIIVAQCKLYNEEDILRVAI
jgi:hypothetical protein